MTPSSKLSPMEVSQALGVHRQTTYDLISKGTLPARKIGKRLVVDREDLERFLASTVVTPESTSTVKGLGIEDPAAGNWFLVWREHATKRNFWFTPDEFSALPDAFINTADGVIRFSIGTSQGTVLKLRFADFTTLSTGSRG